MEPALSPAAWLEFLEPRLDEQAKIIQGYQDYYDGKHRLQMATAKFREAFSRYFPALANNWMKIVVDVPVSRLTVQGFRFATTGDGEEDAPEMTSPDPFALATQAALLEHHKIATTEALANGETPPPKPAGVEDTPDYQLDTDDKAWAMWQANNLDSKSVQVHTEAVKLGVTYLLVAPPTGQGRKGKQPRITPEHPSQCYVYLDPEDSTHRLAGIKRWISDFDGLYYCNVYLPNAIYKFVSTSPAKPGKKIQWKGLESVTNPAGVVPLVPIENKPDVSYGGRSDLEDAIPIQDAINKYCLDMQVSSEFHAFPQRWATGWERGVDDKGREISNREVELYLSASRMIRAEGEDTKFGSFEQGDVENYLKPIMMYLDHLAGQTQTPAYYLKGGTSRSMSADSMHAEDQGLVDRTGMKILSFSDGWEETFRVGFLMLGDTTRGEAESAEIIWKDPESKSLAVVTQAAMIMRQQLDAPIEMCWAMLGWSPQQIRLARSLMKLPPGGGPVKPAEKPSPIYGDEGEPEENDANTHPGNQKGQPSGQASLAAARP